jgi:hypothetical protein
VTPTTQTRTLRTYERTGTERDETDGECSEQGALAPQLEAACPSLEAVEKLRKAFGKRGVTPEIQSDWLATYPDPAYLAREAMKAITWESANPKRRKKNFATFLSNWIGKGWDQRSTRPPAPISPAASTGEDQAELRRLQAMAREAAARIVAAVPKFGRDYGDKARPVLGDLGARIVERQGGWAKIHEMLDDGANLSALQAQWRELGTVMLTADSAVGGPQ